MMTVVLEIRGVSMSHPSPDGRARLPILTDVDLRVQAGQVAALHGPSGSGKTTLLSICGLLQPVDSGEVQVAGRSAAGMGAGARTALRAETTGFIFQSARLVPHLTARENILLPLLANGWSTGTTRADELLERVGLSARATHLPGQLSGGEQQRVAACRALVRSPVLVLADEPTGNLDAESTGVMLRLFREVADRGVAILVATHDPAVVGWADESLSLERGRLVPSVTPASPGRPAQ